MGKLLIVTALILFVVATIIALHYILPTTTCQIVCEGAGYSRWWVTDRTCTCRNGVEIGVQL